MSNEAKRLMSLLLEKKDVKITEFTEKYEIWSSFFSDASKDPLKTYQIVANLKLVVLCGLAESLGVGDGYSEKFRQFMDFLSIEEKLFFSLVIGLKQKDGEAQKIWEQYLSNGNENLFKKLNNIIDKEDDEKEKEIEKILVSYPNDLSYLEDVFIKRVNLLYGVRSKIVHKGAPVIGAMMASSGEIISLYGDKENIFFTIKYPIDEFFLRAACRYFKIEPHPMVENIENYCNDKLISRHARSETMLIHNLKKRFEKKEVVDDSRQ